MSAALYDPGWLRHRVTVESAAGVADGAGGETVTWDTLATLWAHLAPVSDGEKIVAGHLSGVVTHEVTLRWRDDIAGGMRIAYRGRTFRILAVYDPDETRRYVVAKTSEEAP
ncbi:MAG TPA: phage head closure protein [Bauldia sp.]|nr:phage head closure protein [Bauldia sp.]